jgi:DNA transformation protein
VGDPFVDDLLDRLEPLGKLRARKMFGGTGLYCDGIFFGLVAGDVLYFKVDAENLAPYEEAGMARFRPFEDRGGSSLGYYEVPLEVQERPARLVEWARAALAAARRRDATKTKTKTKTKKKTSKSKRAAELPRPSTAAAGATPVSELENIDAGIARWLADVGIRTRADLERAGSLKAYQKVRAARCAPPLEVLWALEGALLGVSSDQVTPQMRERLLMRIRRFRG